MRHLPRGKRPGFPSTGDQSMPVGFRTAARGWRGGVRPSIGIVLCLSRGPLHGRIRCPGFRTEPHRNDRITPVLPRPLTGVQCGPSRSRLPSCVGGFRTRTVSSADTGTGSPRIAIRSGYRTDRTDLRPPWTKNAPAVGREGPTACGQRSTLPRTRPTDRTPHYDTVVRRPRKHDRSMDLIRAGNSFVAATCTAVRHPIPIGPTTVCRLPVRYCRSPPAVGLSLAELRPRSGPDPLPNDRPEIHRRRLHN